MKRQLLTLFGILLVVGIFSASQNSVFGQDTIADDNKVELLNHKVKGSEGSNKLIGQVQNMLDKNVEFVEIIATFYDENREMIGTDSTYSQPADLNSKMKAPFEMTLDDDIANEMNSYDITITWRDSEDFSSKFSNAYELSQELPQTEEPK